MQPATSSSVTQRNNIDNIYPLSPMQQGILFHTVSATETGLYTPQTALRIVGPADGEALRRAWQTAIDRHPILRSAFFWEERDEPFQIAFKQVPLSWQALDWRQAGADHDTRLKQLFAVNRATPFDLRKPSQLRVQWIRTAAEEHILVIGYHHLILDGWSIRQLLDEVLLLYCREIGVSTAPLAPLRPYADYIGWLKGRDGAASVQFWRDYLAGLPGPTLLCGDAAEAAFERRRWDSPPALHEALKAFCARHMLTMNTLLQGAFGLLAARRSGRDDLVFGTTVSGRPATLAGATAMIGLFINTLPVRVTLQADAPLASWLTALQQRQAETLDHDYVPLSDIQGRGASLFDTLLVVENFSFQSDGARPLPFRVENIDFDERTHFPLTVWAVPRADGLTLMAGSGSLSPAALSELLASLGEILTEMMRAPDASLQAHLERVRQPQGLATPRNQPAPAAQQPVAMADTALATPTEIALARTFAEVLKCGPLDRSANFFSLGGHSLLAARVISRLRGELSVNVPVRALFERPVLADLAAHIDGLRAAGKKTAHVEIEI